MRYSAEPYSYAEARALADELGVSEPVAVTLVRRGYRTSPSGAQLPRRRRDPRPAALRGDGRGGRDAAARRPRTGGGSQCTATTTSTASARPRSWSRPCASWGPVRLVHPRPPRGRLRAQRQGGARLAERGTEVLITADCGITCARRSQLASELGMRGRRHRPPRARRANCPIARSCIRGYPAIRSPSSAGPASPTSSPAPCGRRESWGEDAAEADLDLVALATVADVVPLVGENRSLVRRGLVVAGGRGAPAAGPDRCLGQRAGDSRRE